MNLVDEVRAAWAAHRPDAERAYEIAASFCPNMPRLPGCDTALRLAHYIYHGLSVEQAAAREYRYRWMVALQSGRFVGAAYAPHQLGL